MGSYEKPMNSLGTVSICSSLPASKAKDLQRNPNLPFLLKLKSLLFAAKGEKRNRILAYTSKTLTFTINFVVFYGVRKRFITQWKSHSHFGSTFARGYAPFFRWGGCLICTVFSSSAATKLLMITGTRGT